MGAGLRFGRLLLGGEVSYLSPGATFGGNIGFQLLSLDARRPCAAPQASSPVSSGLASTRDARAAPHVPGAGG